MRWLAGSRVDVTSQSRPLLIYIISSPGTGICFWRFQRENVFSALSFTPRETIANSNANSNANANSNSSANANANDYAGPSVNGRYSLPCHSFTFIHGSKSRWIVCSLHFTGR